MMPTNATAGVIKARGVTRTVARIAAAEAAGEAFIAAHPELVRETPGYDPCTGEGNCPDDDEDFDEAEDADEVPEAGSCDRAAIERKKGF